MQTPSAFIRGLRHPEAFHGEGKNKNFFEGWYIKLVSEDLSQRWAVIPGIFRGLKNSGGDSKDEAFVQVLDGLTGRSWYHQFPVEEFKAKTTEFDVWVGENHFHSKGVTLNLPQLKGTITYQTELDPWPVTLASPGIMGWYGMVPFMECFHGIVSFGHVLSGTLEIEGNAASFSKGKGYIEKDWGQAFPAGYVWLHSNHIDSDPEASMVASVAIIPWIGNAFRGFIIGLKHSNKLHKWTTYNSSKEELLTIDDSHIHWKLTGPDGTLEISAERVRGGLLHAPLREAMHQRVEETLDAKIQIKHTSKQGKVLLEGTGLSAAMEVYGDIDRLLAI